MGIRQTVNENPAISASVTGAVILLAIIFSIWQLFFSHKSSPHGNLKAFYSDDDGTTFFADEAVFAWGRVLRQNSPAHYAAPLVAASVGETASACGVLMIALALDMARKGWAAGPNTLVHLTSAATSRGAFVLQAI